MNLQASEFNIRKMETVIEGTYFWTMDASLFPSS